MALTIQAHIGQRITIDPADSRGPWTIELPGAGVPDPAGYSVYNGAVIWIKRTTLSTTPVTIRPLGSGTQMEDPFYGGKSAEIVWRGSGECLEMVYNSALLADPIEAVERNTWLFYGNYNPARPAPQFANWAGSLLLTPSEQMIPLDEYAGGQDRYTYLLGELVAAYDATQVHQFEGHVKLEYAAGANNLEAQAFAGWRMRQGFGTELGTIINIDDTFAFQSSRSGNWDVHLAPTALILPKQGNVVTLMAYQSPATNMTATASEAFAQIT